MNCPKCGMKIVGHHRRCDGCGQDLRPYDDLRRISNRLYNEGLEMAKVHNLTSAMELLQKSLEFNKENIDARNLLGLVYYELGETVAAIVEWVISTNIRRFDNPADELLKKLQSDANEFRDATTAIKKYNIALEMAKNGNTDLALIQLKKVVSLNPHYVKALLLLALLYMRNNENEKARKTVKKVLAVDVGNLTARKYLAELRSISEMAQKGGVPDNFDYGETGESESPTVLVKGSSYREERPNFTAFITFFAGILIGVVIIFFFAVPGIEKKLRSEYDEKTRQLGIEQAGFTTKISGLESEKATLNDRISDLTTELLYERSNVTTDFLPFLELYREYELFVKNTIEPAEKKRSELIAERQALLENADPANPVEPDETPIELFSDETQGEVNEFAAKIEAFDAKSLNNTTVNAMYKEMLSKIKGYVVIKSKEEAASEADTSVE